MMRPQLKAIAAVRRPGKVVLARRSLEELVLSDEDGSVAALIQVLAQGRRTVAELPLALRQRGYEVSESEISDAVDALDEAGVLLRTDSDAELSPATRRRHESNLRFYDIFAGLHRTSAGSGVLQALVGLGVGRVRLVDFDRVEEKNLARQFAYGLDEVGRPKVAAARAWAQRYAPGVTVDAIHQRVTDAESIRRLGVGADVVVCAIDSPAGVQLLVDEACFALGVPYVVGGLRYSTLFYYSVEPGVSACRRCLELRRADQARAMPERGDPDLINSAGSVNRATGPIAQLLAGFVTLEAVRYVTRTDPPVAAATYHTIDLADDMRAERAEWHRHPDCPQCPDAA